MKVLVLSLWQNILGRSEETPMLETLLAWTWATVLSGSLIFGENALCLRGLGCNAGFFGYDALEHFMSGVFGVIFVVWLMRVFPAINLFHGNYLKNFAILLMIVAFLGVSWEFVEFSNDHMISRIHAFRGVTAMIGKAVQPNNTDTMGDLFFDLLGGAAAAALVVSNKSGAEENSTESSSS